MSYRDHLNSRAPRHSARTLHPKSRIAILAMILVSLLAVFLVFYIKGQEEVVHTDPITLCPTDRPPSEVVVLLLDMSDVFSEPQRLKIRNEFDRLKGSMSRFSLIEAYVVDRLEQRVTKPVVHLCNPGTGSDLNRIYQNPDLARKKWDGFVRQLDAELQRLMDTPESPTSAIFEAVQASALRTFNRPDYDGLPKRLVIVSDLLQNVPGKLSQYEGIVPFQQFQHSAYFSEIRADLTGVAVTLLYLVRPRAPQKWPDHYLFWEEYFRAQGATVERLEPVHGAQ